MPKIAMYLLDITRIVQRKVASVVEGKVTLDPTIAEDKKKILGLWPDIEDLKQLRMCGGQGVDIRDLIVAL